VEGLELVADEELRPADADWPPLFIGAVLADVEFETMAEFGPPAPVED